MFDWHNPVHSPIVKQKKKKKRNYLDQYECDDQYECKAK